MCLLCAMRRNTCAGQRGYSEEIVWRECKMSHWLWSLYTMRVHGPLTDRRHGLSILAWLSITTPTEVDRTASLNSKKVKRGSK